MENQPTLEDFEYEELIEQNRERYGITPEIPDIEFTTPAAKKAERTAPAPKIKAFPAPQPPPLDSEPEEAVEAPTMPDEENDVVEPVKERILRAKAPIPRYTPKEPGGGGKQHKYLASLVKNLAEERGFKASIEETILDGTGRVDVALSRGDRKIAVEISVTTGNDWELGNVQKCLSAGYEEVIVVSTNPRHLKSLARFIPANLEEDQKDKVKFLSPEEFIEYLGKDGTTPPTSTENTVRGYKVRVVTDAVSEQEAESKRDAIAEIIAKSMQRGKD